MTKNLISKALADLPISRDDLIRELAMTLSLQAVGSTHAWVGYKSAADAVLTRLDVLLSQPLIKTRSAL